MLSQLEAKLDDLDERYYRFSQQQRSFIDALTCARQSLYFPSAVKTLNEVTEYLHGGKLERSNDIRVVEQFLLLCDDLEGLRKDFKRHLIECLEINDRLRNLKTTKNLVYCMRKWRKMLDPECDFSSLKAKFPHNVVQKLSSVEAQEFYAGVVSFLPFLFDNVKLALQFLKEADKKSVWGVSNSYEQTEEIMSNRSSMSRMSDKSFLNTSRPVSVRYLDKKGPQSGEMLQQDEDVKDFTVLHVGESRPATTRSSAKGSQRPSTRLGPTAWSVP